MCYHFTLLKKALTNVFDSEEGFRPHRSRFIHVDESFELNAVLGKEGRLESLSCMGCPACSLHNQHPPSFAMGLEVLFGKGAIDGLGQHQNRATLCRRSQDNTWCLFRRPYRSWTQGPVPHFLSNHQGKVFEWSLWSQT